MKKLITHILRSLAQYKLRRTKPTIIGVTGSYGKTTLKEVIAAILGTKYRVLKSQKSLNTEIGMSLAILEQRSGFSNPVAWLQILIGATYNALFSRSYDFCVLEYGVDRPGDMDYLLTVAKPDCAIITAVAQVHQAEDQFSSLEEVLSEKAKLAYAVAAHGHVILNHSYATLTRIGSSVHAQTHYYNDAHNYAEHLEQKNDGITGKLHVNKTKHDLYMPVIGAYHSDCALVGFIIGDIYGVPTDKIQKALRHFELPPGRMSLIKAKHGATLIDSSYNASPDTVVNALSILKTFPARRRIAVLGTMNELGGFYEAGHKRVAEACGTWLDVLIGVGEGGIFITQHALNQTQKPATIKAFPHAAEVVSYLQKTLKLNDDDVVLFKGSQNKVRLERAVKLLMANPLDADRLLCRQEKEWLQKE